LPNHCSLIYRASEQTNATERRSRRGQFERD
jgi:hypothetical protein